MKEERLEQLKRIFKTKIEGIIDLAESHYFFTNKKDRENYIQETTNNLAYEVKIRIDNK